jgi:glycerol-3-phosphate dehydrogenase
LLPSLATSDFIRCYTGLRAKQTPPSIGGFSDFVLESRKDIPGFINLLGIESPGLTSSPAIALKVRDMVGALLPLEQKDAFVSERPGMLGYVNERSSEEKADLIAENPDYGKIICRCEQITKKEILDAIENPLGVRTLAGIKYRARAMMGRCQGSYCRPKIIQILENEFGYGPEDYQSAPSRPPLFGLRD